MQKDLAQQLTDVLKAQFHFDQFRPGQLEALIMLMTNGRLLCIQPTGYGKSLLYQLPAIMLDGITLVISPLLALMRDQITQLQDRFGIVAASFNTDQSNAENTAMRKDILAGNIRILFIAPEQLDHIDRFNFLLKLPIKLLVVDEAHCISTWGHDFRPSYRQIIHLVHALTKKSSDIKLLALTATANIKTEEDIKQQLTVDHQGVTVHRENMDRPNIRLSVIPINGTNAKLATLIDLLAALSGSGLIYCATRENTELVAEFLNSQSISAAAYHAGFETEQKRRIQHDFIHDKYTVIAATNALGMGIDKSNLRYIIHFDFPGSITAYYQETGRCGRDGLPADGILLYDPADSKIHRHFIESAQPTVEDFKLILNSIAESDSAPNLTTLKRSSGLHPTKLTVIVAELVEQGFVKKMSRKGYQTYQATHRKDAPDLSRYDTQRRIRNIELANMQRYAEQTQHCLMALLRNALGDIDVQPCGKCSRCTNVPFTPSHHDDLITAISSWINSRTVPIILSKKIENTAVGMAVLDGKLRSDLFIQFMRERTSDSMPMVISDLLLKLIKSCLLDLAKRHQFSCIIPIPSRTWSSQHTVVDHLAKYLKIPAINNMLGWSKVPSARQGELLNNDQRKHNVAQRMYVLKNMKIPKGTILLLDDYLGSGATMNEASRALREHGCLSNKIVPFTIATVKWRLGKSGMI